MDRRSKVQYNAEEAIYSILDLGSDSELSELFSSDEYQDEEVYCDKCNVCLCLSNTRNCFRHFHTTI